MVGKLLSFKPIVGVGLISYSLYLWHFPIFAFGRIGSSNPSTYDKIEWILLAFVLSTVSYFFIEKTFRNSKLLSRKLFFGSVVVSVVTLSYVNYDFIFKDGYKDRLPPILSKQKLDKKVWRHFRQNKKVCFDRKTEFCSIVNGEDLTSVYAFGDSHFSSMSPQLVSALGKNYNYLEANVGGCPFVLNVDRFEDGKVGKCNTMVQNQRVQTIGKDSSIILIGGRFPLYLTNNYFDNEEGFVEGKQYHLFKSQNGITIEEEFSKTVELLISMGHQVVLVYPIPEVGVNVPNLLLNRIKGRSVSDIATNFDLFTTSNDVYLKRTSSTFELFDSIQSSNIHRVYPHTLFCDNQIKGRCVTHSYNDVFYVDDDHPSAKGGEMIVELIMEKIQNAEANIRGN